jgi:Zn-dependent alcohol dehydrogenase
MYLRVGSLAYRGIQAIAQPTPMGHEYCGIVEDVGREVRKIKPGQFVVRSFATSDNTCIVGIPAL